MENIRRRMQKLPGDPNRPGQMRNLPGDPNKPVVMQNLPGGPPDTDPFAPAHISEQNSRARQMLKTTPSPWNFSPEASPPPVAGSQPKQGDWSPPVQSGARPELGIESNKLNEQYARTTAPAFINTEGMNNTDRLNAQRSNRLMAFQAKLDAQLRGQDMGHVDKMTGNKNTMSMHGDDHGLRKQMHELTGKMHDENLGFKRGQHADTHGLARDQLNLTAARPQTEWTQDEFGNPVRTTSAGMVQPGGAGTPWMQGTAQDDDVAGALGAAGIGGGQSATNPTRIERDADGLPILTNRPMQPVIEGAPTVAPQDQATQEQSAAAQAARAQLSTPQVNPQADKPTAYSQVKSNPRPLQGARATRPQAVDRATDATWDMFGGMYKDQQALGQSMLNIAKSPYEMARALYNLPENARKRYGVK